MMAKNTIISDFSALKGKVTFSEKTCAVPNRQENVRTEVRKEERTLQIGQKVIMMDCDIRGKIVSLGRTAGIELEDGLTIQAAYGEFALTDDTEISTLMQCKAKPKKLHTHKGKASQARTSGVLTVDLHIEAIPGGNSIPKGQQRQFQMETFKRIIHENLPHKGRKICFIHGIGDGTLKAAIRKELDEVLALRCIYTVGDPAVTTVTIR